MECDDRVDMLSFGTHVQHVGPHVNIAKRGSFYVACLAPAPRTPGAKETRAGRRDLRRNEYLKLNNSGAQGHDDATRGIVMEYGTIIV